MPDNMGLPPIWRRRLHATMCRPRASRQAVSFHRDAETLRHLPRALPLDRADAHVYGKRLQSHCLPGRRARSHLAGRSPTREEVCRDSRTGAPERSQDGSAGRPIQFRQDDLMPQAECAVERTWLRRQPDVAGRLLPWARPYTETAQRRVRL